MNTHKNFSAGVPAVVVGQIDSGNREGFFSKALNMFSAHEKNKGTLIDQLAGLRACLDNLRVNVFVADQNLNLVYMNNWGLPQS